MSLLYYENLFSNLRLNRSGGHRSPHKVAMMHAVIDGIESGEISNNRIFFNEPLRQRFTKHLRQLRDEERDRNNPHLPYFHLRGDEFWFHRPKPGKKAEYEALTTVGGRSAIERTIQFAYLDDALWELLEHVATREVLKSALDSNLDDAVRDEILAQKGGGSGSGRAGKSGRSADWNWLECELTVIDYFEMLRKYFAGKQFTKGEHIRALLPRLKNRSKGAVEFKYGNISAILVELGLPYLPGYKPAPNYQYQLKRAIFTHLAFAPDDFDTIIAAGEIEGDDWAQEAIDWNKAFDPSPPERSFEVKPSERTYIARRTNFSTRELHNRNLGRHGERLVLEYERHRLKESSRADLADEVEWSSVEKGDGLGYDIRSFDAQYESELFIEVKTTGSGKYQPFFLSENERAFSIEYAPKYRLFRVYDFIRDPRFFVLSGEVEQHVTLIAELYKASFGKRTA